MAYCSTKPIIESGSDDELLGSVNTVYQSDSVPLSQARGEITVYKRRWYLLVVFSLMVAVQAAIWNTWSPISNSAEHVFRWEDSNIALLANWGPITSLCVLAGFSWLLDNYGLRVASLLSAFLVMLGSGLRCITSQAPAASWLINAGHILNGVSGVIGGAGCSLFSVVWFPPYQRATATAIALNSFNLGVAASFVVGPLLVSEVSNSTHHHHHHVHDVFEESASITWNISDTKIKQMTGEIMRLMYYECGLAGLVFLLVLVYFPAKPPTAPSVSAQTERTDFKKGFLALLRMRQFWIVAFSYCISMGVGNAFNGVIDVNLKNFHINQKEAGWIGFYSIVAGSVVAVLTARISDRYPGHMKTMIVTLLLLSGLAGTWSVLILSGYIPFDIREIYASCILVSVFENAVAPLFFELACETSYPVAEGITVGMLAFLGNLVGVTFLLLLMIPKIGVIWMNWCLLGSCFFCFGLMLFFKGSYARLQLDSECIVNNTDPIANRANVNTERTDEQEWGY